MIACFMPSPDSGCFDDFRWPRGLVAPVSNEQAHRLAGYESGVTLYRSGASVAVVLRPCLDRPELYEIAATSKMSEPADEPPTIPDGAEGLGLEHAGRVTALPRKDTGPFVLKLPKPEEPEPDPHGPDDMVPGEMPVTREIEPSHETSSGSDFSQASFPCPVCGEANLVSDARRERHLEMQHPEVFFANDEERASIFAARRAEQEARERIRRAGEKPPPPPVWDRELAGIPDEPDDREPG